MRSYEQHRFPPIMARLLARPQPAAHDALAETNLLFYVNGKRVMVFRARALAVEPQLERKVIVG